MKKQSDWVKTAFRLPRETHTKVHEEADKANRTFNGQLLHFVEAGLAANDSVKKVAA